MPNSAEACRRIRGSILEMSNRAKSAHAGSSLSCVEILYSIMRARYVGQLGISRFVLSKGHAAMALYAAAQELGLLSQELLIKYLQDGSSLWGHPSVNEHFEFIHWSTGSLGHGLPVGTGFAYAEKYLLNKSSPGLVITVVSDGELDEGSNWEGVLFASQHRLNNFIVIVDYNKIQSFGRVNEVMELEPLVDKFKAFGFETVRIDGHSVEALSDFIKLVCENPKGPYCLIADTIKGKGVSAIEDTVESHYKPITDLQLKDFKNAK